MKITTYLFLLSFFIFSSCFEVIEEITVNENGSGKFELTVNLSESKTKLASIMKLDSIEGFKVPSRSQITQIIREVVEHAQTAEGIQNVKHTDDFENFIFNFSCDFEDVDALNQIVERLERIYGKNETVSPDDKHVSFNSSSKMFIRNGNYLTTEEYQKMDSRGKEILDQAKYIGIHRFSSEIQSFDNPNTRLSPNKKASMLKLSIADILQGKVSVGNQLQLK